MEILALSPDSQTHDQPFGLEFLVETIAAQVPIEGKRDTITATGIGTAYHEKGKTDTQVDDEVVVD